MVVERSGAPSIAPSAASGGERGSWDAEGSESLLTQPYASEASRSLPPPAFKPPPPAPSAGALNQGQRAADAATIAIQGLASVAAEAGRSVEDMDAEG